MSQDAIRRLAEDQRATRRLIDDLIERGDQDDAIRAELLQRVERELEVHARIRQEVIQPALARYDGGEEADRRLAACAENDALERMVLPDLKRTEPGTPEFSARLRMFREMLEQHAEADDALLARARAQLTGAELDEVDRRIDLQHDRLR